MNATVRKPTVANDVLVIGSGVDVVIAEMRVPPRTATAKAVRVTVGVAHA